ncbi:hypothetical protein, partial [Streptomyces sp. MUM 203J]|uniref:hypothetical protein n=1 Tax=Streptomyces sp. MUM 203J TaxID=2791990 RepID=UPI001F03FB8D
MTNLPTPQDPYSITGALRGLSATGRRGAPAVGSRPARGFRCAERSEEEQAGTSGTDPPATGAAAGPRPPA